MESLKKLLGMLKNPSKTAVIFAFAALAAFVAGDALVMLFGISYILADVLYALSATTFAYCAYIVITWIIKLRRKTVRWAKKRRLTRRILDDYDFRTIFTAAALFILNAAYAAVNAVYGILFGQYWYCAVAAYYVILSVARGIIVAKHRKISRDGGLGEAQKRVRDLKIYRAAGALLIVMMAALDVMLWFSANYPGGDYGYGKIMVIALAAFTAYKIVAAVCNLVKVRKSDSFSVHAVRNINFTNALVSALTLQIAMLTVEGGGGGYGNMNAFLGSAICLFAGVLGTYMIVVSSRKINSIYEPHIMSASGGTGEDSARLKD